MTNIKIERRNDDIIGVECSNHTGFAESGKDIVCAGVSSITQTAILGIQKLTKVKTDVVVDEKMGFLKLKLDIDGNAQSFHDAQIILKTMLCGLKDLSEQYPKYIKLEDTK